MRLSTSTNIMNFDHGKPYMVSFEHAVSTCAAAGYRYLDVNLCGMSRAGKRFAPMTEDNWEEQAHAWRKLADDIGVRFLQGHAYFSIGGPVAPGEVPGGDFGEEMMRRSVLAAEILGAELLPSNADFCARFDFAPRYPAWLKVWFADEEFPASGRLLLDESKRANLAYFRRWHEFFHAHHVGMAIENMNTLGKGPSPFSNIDNLIELIDAINAPDVGACLDTGHAHTSGYSPADCVRSLGSRLRATHINDNHAGDRDEHIAPFMGTIDWPALVAALREIHYAHDFSFETQNLTSPFPMRIQGDLIRFSYTLGEYLLSDELFTDADALAKY